MGYIRSENRHSSNWLIEFFSRHFTSCSFIEKFTLVQIASVIVVHRYPKRIDGAVVGPANFAWHFRYERLPFVLFGLLLLLFLSSFAFFLGLLRLVAFFSFAAFILTFSLAFFLFLFFLFLVFVDASQSSFFGLFFLSLLFFDPLAL